MKRNSVLLSLRINFQQMSSCFSQISKLKAVRDKKLAKWANYISRGTSRKENFYQDDEKKKWAQTEISTQGWRLNQIRNGD